MFKCSLLHNDFMFYYTVSQNFNKQSLKNCWCAPTMG